MKNKVYYKSLTIWVNFIILALSLFDAQFFMLFDLSEHTTAIILGVIVKIIAVGNIALRLFLSDTKLVSSKDKE
jgi:hypothetical protein